MSEDIARLSIRVSTLEMDAANKKMQTLSKSGMDLESVLKKVAGAFGVYQLGQFVKDMTLLSARYETMGVVVNVVGNNAGYAAKEMAKFQEDLQKAGISAMESRNTLATMAQAHIDLARSTDLARVAQDAAVIGQMNSSEAFQRMIYGIQSGQVEILRTIGLNVNFEQSYAKLGLTLGKTAKDLDETEKTQARVNAVMAKAPDLAGVYSSAMETAGKQLYSMKRYSDDLQLSWGALFKPALGTVIGALNQGFREMKEWTAKNKSEMDLLGGAIGGTTGQMIDMTKAMAGLSTDAATGADGFLFLRRTVQGVGGILAVVTDDITALRVALLDWAYVAMSSMENTLNSILAVSKAIPSALFVGNKAEIMAEMSYAKTFLNISSTLAKQRADALSMKPLAVENWLNGLDQVDNPKAWKDKVKTPGKGGSTGTSTGSKGGVYSQLFDQEADVAAWERDYLAEQDRLYAAKVDFALQVEDGMAAMAQREAEDLKRVHTDLFGDLGYAIDQWSQDFGDAFVDMCFTGKNSFADLTNSILKDLARMAMAESTSGLASWIGSLFTSGIATRTDGGISLGGNSNPVPWYARAAGGPVSGGSPYLVGEAGPELFVPRQSGTIVPNKALGGGSVSVVNNISISSSGQVEAKSEAGNMQALGTLMASTCRQVIANEQRAGGLLASA